jgi:uncharacterized protein YbjT (DUF2867 family)
MKAQTAVLLGASGLTGSFVLHELLAHPSFEKVRVLVRRPLPITHSKLEQCIVDFNDYEAYQSGIGISDSIFCCIGTTLAKVKGNKQEYRKIDFDIPVNAARFGRAAGCRHFLLVSSHLANSRSRFFYPRLKGETEEIIETFGYPGLHIFRPSFLTGPRKEKRWTEQLGGGLLQALSFLLPASSKPIAAATVAKAMVEAALTNEQGLHFYYYNEMQALSKEIRPL